MFDVISFLFLSVVVFAGAVVAGFAGFAFSAVAGAMLLHVLPPAEAVPLMMICSIVVQTVNLVALRRNMEWQGSLVPIVGGALGVPPALYLLQNVDTSAFRIGFGCLLAAYSAYMLFRPAMARLPQTDTRRLPHAALGFAGGLLGGLTAMPGAPLTIWCDLKGMPKEQQRGLIQPFIVTMQVVALGMMLARHSLSTQVLVDAAYSLPALFAGSAAGIAMFGWANDALFRRATLGILFVAGFALVV